jgi:hyperosmotically inducible protein
VVVIAQDLDRLRPAVIVKDSVVTIAIKTKLAAQPSASLERIRVDTDKDGVVWLSGKASSRAAAAKAVAIARATGHNKEVHSEIKIRKNDSTDTTPPLAQQRQPSQAGDRGVEDAVGLSLALALLSGAGAAPR